ncbi:ornithine cyclodeaminase [Cobetia sp. 10Alg 146]|uniref:ornithine cyclodeaminase n=1 Tax=Cobetia sp. 10Alg 146 TaxID=3040019 RepID=UPI002449C1F3|nr:ornithine cyclodeaminase [Cobetia sp. 10Alg 146]MDH2292369.1 ornithine cyclodeaminase [Cobetia sp. 10Alg 146]
MTRFVDVPTLSRMVDHIGEIKFFNFLVDYLESDYQRWFEFDKSARVAAHSEIGVIELMPVADSERYTFKYVNGHPGNPTQGLMTVMAFGVLSDVDSGYPVLLSELTLSTAFRTAATSVMVARHMARSDSTVMALIGNGSQSEFQALAFHHLLGIREIRCFDVDSNASEKLAYNLSGLPGLRVILCESAHEATKGADIITTVTADKCNATILTPDMVSPGVHINGVGGDCPGKTEIHVDILQKSRIIVEYAPQSRIEGEIQQMPEDHPVTEFWEVLANKSKGRINDTEITIFDSVGFALEDYSTLRLINDCARELKLGEDILLVPVPDDPKDLYSLLGRARSRLKKAG